MPIFDFIYIDGDHSASAVLEDAVLAFAHLKKGGIMIFDDYEWTGMSSEQERPKMAVDAFVAIYADKLTVINRGYQLAIKKV
jgi:predicted O-methyltransferase YrrM